MAICIALGRGLQPLLSNRRPTWATPFVKEFTQQVGMTSLDQKKRPTRSANILLVICLAGFGLRLVTVFTMFYPHLSTTTVAPCISWVTDLP